MQQFVTAGRSLKTAIEDLLQWFGSYYISFCYDLLLQRFYTSYSVVQYCCIQHSNCHYSCNSLFYNGYFILYNATVVIISIVPVFVIYIAAVLLNLLQQLMVSFAILYISIAMDYNTYCNSL